MNYLLYNEKSNNGKPLKVANKFNKKYLKNQEATFLSIYDILNKEKDFCNSLSDTDIVYIFGGDGTFHEFLNRIYPLKVNFKIFAYACGRGNDLSRDYKKNKPFEITNLVNDLPVIKVNDKDEYVFINGVGMGVDSYVCDKQINNAKFGVKESYFSVALKVLKKFVPYHLELEIDGEVKHFDKVWFFVCNHGAYFGGGMRITPKAKREDEFLDVCIVNNIKLWKLILIFPLVFFGLHTLFFKKSIKYIQCKHLKVKTFGCSVLQQDGEVFYDVNSIEVRR